jgi:spore coat-associated protein N
MAALHSRILVVVVSMGLFAAAFLSGDHGSARAAVGSATGPLIASDRADTAVLVARGMAPGETRSGDVTITNVGDSSGAFVLTESGLTDSTARLSSVLGLTVSDVTPGRSGSQLYAGPMSGLSGVQLGVLAQGEVRTYRFTVNVAAGAGNAYQGATTSMGFVWTTTATAAAPDPVPTPVPTPVVKPQAKVVPLPTASLTASSRQTGAKGSVAATIVCQARCQATLSGSALDGEKSLAMKTVRRNIITPAKVRMRINLPKRAKDALKEGRALAVRLRLKATMGTRVLVVRRTVRVEASHR